MEYAQYDQPLLSAVSSTHRQPRLATEYTQYDQPSNQRSKIPHIQSAVPTLPQNSSPQPYIYKQPPSHASNALPSQAQNHYQQRSGRIYHSMGYPQYVVPEVRMHGFSPPQATAMATTAVAPVLAPSIDPEIRGTEKDSEDLDPRYVKRNDAKNLFEVGRLWPGNAGDSQINREGYLDRTTAGAGGISNLFPAPSTVKIRHENEADGIQHADVIDFRLWTLTNEVERRLPQRMPQELMSDPLEKSPLVFLEDSPLYVNAREFSRLKRRVDRQKPRERLPLTSRRNRGTGSKPVTRRLDILSEAATPTKPLPLTSQTLNKDLPIGINGKKFNASADTGSDECGMPKDIADHLGLKVRCAPSDIKDFEIGNGRKIKSIGRTTVDCSFWNEPGKKLRCVFYVFERLIVPLIMGRAFLERTDTLTQHQDRLVDRAPRTGLCRVMHLSRPKRRMRCYIDSDLVEANPDTGAEMELVSPHFIKRKGYAVEEPDVAHEVVQFVDGSTARTQGQVKIKFEAYGDAFQEAVPSKACYRTFYVLDGLTTDILLGEDLLYSINAFTEHTSSFVDLDDFGIPIELKGIVWLNRAEQRLASIFGGDLSGSSTTLALGSAGIDTQSRMQRFTTLIGRATGARTQSEAIRTARRELDFEEDMDNRDARENARQEIADLRIDRLPPSQQATAEEQEERVRQAFCDDQRQRRQQHEAALAAAVRSVPMA